MPIPFADGTLLTPLEVGLIKGLSKIYKVEYDNNTELIQIIVNAGAAGVIGKTALSGQMAGIAADYTRKKAEGKVSTKDMLGIILKNIRK